MGCTMGLSDDSVSVRIEYQFQTMHNTCQKSGFLKSGEGTIVCIYKSSFFFWDETFRARNARYGLCLAKPVSHEPLFAQVIAIFVSLFSSDSVMDRFHPLLLSGKGELQGVL